MGRMYKIALAILYLAQIIVLVREPAAHLYKVAIEKDEPSAASAPVVVDLRQVLKQAFRTFGLAQCISAAPPPRNDSVSVQIDKEAHQHTPEDKQALVRKQRRRYHYLVLLLNLYPAIKKDICPTAERALASVESGFRRLSFFPPSQA